MPKTPRRIEVRIDPDLADRFDEARGDVPAATFIRRLIERAVGSTDNSGNNKRSRR